MGVIQKILHQSLSRRSALRRVQRCSGLSGQFPDFINYEIVETEIEKELQLDRKWISSENSAKTMKLGNHEPASYTESKDIIEHINARGYESSDVHNESSRRVLSSLLSFPLTLAYAHKLLYPAVPSKVNVLIVGARAESSLPLLWWKDCLYNNDKLENLSIKMTGPGIQKINSNATPQSEEFHTDSWKLPSVNPTVNVSRLYTANNMKLLHDNDEALQLLQWADVFLLYNPGMSSKSLKASWDPSIRLLLETRKPIICTAHGETDLGNDLNHWNKISSEEDTQELGESVEFLIPPHLNPFRSLTREVDVTAPEFSDGRVVSTNCYLYALQSK